MSKKSVSVSHLLPLGTPKLAEVLVELADSHKEVHKRLERLLSISGSGKQYESAIRKQISSLFGKNKFYDYYQSRNLAEALDGIRTSIINDLLFSNPLLTAKLLKELLKSGKRAVECADDSGGEVGDVFRQTAIDWGDALSHIPDVNPIALAEEMFELVVQDEYGFTRGVVERAAIALGSKGLKHLESLVRKELQHLPKLEPIPETGNPRMKIILGRNADPSVLPAMFGVDFSTAEIFDLKGNEVTVGGNASHYTYLSLLRDIADAKGDPDLFIEACSTCGRPETYSSDIAERMLKANRAQEALSWLEKAPPQPEWFDDHPVWIKIKALDMLGRKEDAQKTRWDAFAKSMDERFYVDYADNSAETGREDIRRRAVEEALCQLNPYRAMKFLTWLRDSAALKTLVIHFQNTLNGAHYKELTSAAEFLSPEEPEAASILYRLMVQHVLQKATSKYYVYAARNLKRAESCARYFREGQTLLSNHAEFLQELKAKHARKYSFWQQVEETSKTYAKI